MQELLGPARLRREGVDRLVLGLGLHEAGKLHDAAAEVRLAQAGRMPADQQHVPVPYRQPLQHVAAQHGAGIDAGQGCLHQLHRVHPWREQQRVGQRGKQHFVVAPALGAAPLHDSGTVRRVAVVLYQAPLAQRAPCAPAHMGQQQAGVILFDQVGQQVAGPVAVRIQVGQELVQPGPRGGKDARADQRVALQLPGMQLVAGEIEKLFRQHVRS
ncbi:hypothetical protein [Pseudoduganella lutea]|uniref:Uncharacterized protein n=1 Tax=Pseudoduganella lutea TaxID=321985 RepID=A0A4P6L5E2_9BURK|nr:hypothetical protein [Pseudoduganella lutea]QBE66674.1 hypothetical protein EWM63_29965 [Pseudoduganella lutea]